MTKMRALIALGLGGTLSVFSSAAPAAGFFIAEQSVKGLGNAFAGWAASAEDASTIFYNPAGLTRLNRQLDFGVHVIRPSSKFKNEGSTTTRDLAPPFFSQDTTGSDRGNAGVTVAVPNLYYAGVVTEKLRWGIGIFTPFGLATRYDEDWVGRYFAVESELKTVNINPAVAYRFLKAGLSIGGGVSAQYADGKLTSKFDGGAPAGVPGTNDANQELEGNDWGFGYNLGLLYEFSPQTRIGLQYRSRIDHTVKGSLTTTEPLPSESRGAKLDLNLPDILSGSIYHQFASTPLAIMADATWMSWGRLKQLDVTVDDGTAFAEVLDYQDTWRYAVGLTINPQEHWRVRTGFAYDETPVKNARTRSARIPDSDRTWLTLGFGWDPTDSLVLDLAYAHLIYDDAPIDISNTDVADTTHTLKGRYESDVDIISAQLSWTFK